MTTIATLVPVVGYNTILSQISSWQDPLTQVIRQDIGRIAWNIFLALVPLALSFSLFYRPRSRLFCWSIYCLLSLSSIVGIKKYNDGDLLKALERIINSLWGVRLIFVAISIGLIIILTFIDRRWHSRSRTELQIPTVQNRSIFWWIGLLLFIVILPNAPYVLTDVIHFYDAVRTIDSAWTITLVIVPIYVVFIGVGWFAYVLSLINVGRYFTHHRIDRYLKIAELSLHLLCAIGIYIGRFIRFNSWSLVTQPKQFLSILPGELIGKFPLVVILLTFSIIAILYAICKPLSQRLFIYGE
jgi:uncharacterized membrane protein